MKGDDFLNERIKAIRKQKKLTQSEFGAIIGVKGNTNQESEHHLMLLFSRFAVSSMSTKGGCAPVREKCSVMMNVRFADSLPNIIIYLKPANA